MSRALMEVLICATALMAVDQWTKRQVRLHVAGRPLACPPLGRIRLLESSKREYRDNRGRAVLVVIWMTALVAAVALHVSGSWFQTGAGRLGLACAFGGAAGNLLDILRRRRVIDFIDLGWWPVFNIADVAIVGGLVVTFWAEI